MKITLNPFKKYKEEYWKADKRRKGEILNVMVEWITNYESRKNNEQTKTKIYFTKRRKSAY